MLRRSMVITLVLVMALFAISCGKSKESGKESSGEEAAAQKTVEKLLQALQNRDIDALMALLLPSYIQKNDAELAQRISDFEELLREMKSSGENAEELERELAVMRELADTRSYLQRMHLQSYESLRYDDLVFRSTAAEGIALVGIFEGLATVVDSRGETHTEEAAVSGPFYYVLEKVGGEWFVDLGHSNLWIPACST